MIEIAEYQYFKQIDWFNAKIYCQFLTIDNKSNWRLPTLEEAYYMPIPTAEYCWTDTEFNIRDYRANHFKPECISNFVYTARTGMAYDPPYAIKTFDGNIAIPVRDVEV